MYELAEADDGGTLSWQERALCAQTDPEAFFPEKGGSTREAKKVCLSCDVRGPVPGVRAGARRALRHLGWPERAGAAQAEETRRLSRLLSWQIWRAGRGGFGTALAVIQ